MSEAHLDPHEVAAYLSGTADRAARERIEAHLADCEACTGELVAVRRLHHSGAPSHRWRLPAAAAAILAVALLTPRLLQRESKGPPPVRGDSVASAIVAISPPDGATLGAPPTFTWRRVAGAGTYRLSVTGESGDSVWGVSVTDTSATPPPGALAPAGRYYWYVDALLSDGSSLPGTAHEFRLGP